MNGWDIHLVSKHQRKSWYTPRFFFAQFIMKMTLALIALRFFSRDDERSDSWDIHLVSKPSRKAWYTPNSFFILFLKKCLIMIKYFCFWLWKCTRCLICVAITVLNVIFNWNYGDTLFLTFWFKSELNLIMKWFEIEFVVKLVFDFSDLKRKMRLIREKWLFTNKSEIG